MSTITYDPNNIFSQILTAQVPSYEIYRDTICLAILDIMPESKGHILVIPCESSIDFLSLSSNTAQQIIIIVQKLARAAKNVFNANGILIRQHNGTAAGQTIFHCHFHIIPCYHKSSLNMHANHTVSHQELQKQANLIKAFLDSKDSAS